MDAPTVQTDAGPVTEPEDVGHEEKVDKAFINSENHSLNGEKLQPYSPARIIAAQAMGLRYGYVDKAGLEFFKKHKIYPGALRDVVVVLWLCSLSDEDDIDEASREPKGAIKTATKWAADRGIVDANSDKFWDSYALFMQIIGEIDDSRVSAEKKSPKEDGHLKEPETI
jgi:hypothetical protein